MVNNIDFHTLSRILQLQLLIARAGQNDSMRWWEDDSLTDSGGYLLERLFPFAPHTQGRKLALLSAKNRHDAVLGIEAQVFHLFSFGFDDERDPGSSEIDLADLELPNGPIRSINELETQLSVILAGTPSQTNSNTVSNNYRVLIEMPANSGTIDAANQLAWAYLQAEPGKPVFPYFKET